MAEHVFPRLSVGRLPVLVLGLAVSLVAACGGGGGGGGGSGALEVLDEVTFLLNDGGADPRTGQKLQFILRGLSDPGTPLTEDEIEVRPACGAGIRRRSG